MSMIVIDKDYFKTRVSEIVGASVRSFIENQTSPSACSVEVEENLEESGWRGKWTERIRESASAAAPDAACVCVKPLVCGKPGIVYYRVSVG